MVRDIRHRIGSVLGRRSPAFYELEQDRENCPRCQELVAGSSLYSRFRVCPSCGYHCNLTARERISITADPGTFSESQRSMVSIPFQSPSALLGSKKRSIAKHNRTGLTDAVVTGTCKIEGHSVVLIALDFRFVGSSLGGVVGEKITLAFEKAARRKIPVVAISTSGKSTEQPGFLSLMQMAKTAFASNRLSQAHVPYISILTNPTTGQVYASLARHADVILAEPESMLGMAPPGAHQDDPVVQTNTSHIYAAEAHRARGMIDNIVHRENLKGVLAILLHSLRPQQAGTPGNGPAQNKTQYDQRPEHDGLLELWPSGWTSVSISNSGQRPTSLDYAQRIFHDFVELHGDRLYGDDPSIIVGVGTMGKYKVAFIGQEKGHELTSLQRRQGRTMPEGYRKAQRMILLASKFQIPLITLIDTPGPYYGRDSEERGLGSAMATTMSLLAQAPIPTLAAIVGEGGSEGALALGVTDRVLMLENARYIVTSPEDATALLYRDQPNLETVIEPLILSSKECQEVGIADILIPEPPGGAQRNPDQAAQNLLELLEQELAILVGRSLKRVLKDRYHKYRNMGEYSSFFKVAVANEISQLQRYVAQSVRVIKRRTKSRRKTPPKP